MNTEDLVSKLTDLELRVQQQPDNGEAWLELADFLEDYWDASKQITLAIEKAQQLMPAKDLRRRLDMLRLRLASGKGGSQFFGAVATKSLQRMAIALSARDSDREDSQDDAGERHQERRTEAGRGS